MWLPFEVEKIVTDVKLQHSVIIVCSYLWEYGTVVMTS